MRKLIVCGLVLLLLIGGLLGFAVSNLNGLVNANKDQLLAQVEQALGRTVEIGEIEISLWGGVGARLQNVTLADDPAFSSETFVRATDLQIKVKLMPLLRQEIEVRRVLVRDPVIRVIRNPQGVFNFASLGGGETQDAPPQISETTTASSAVESLPLLLVALANISNGDIHYTDQHTDTELRVSQLDLKVENLSFDRPLSLELAAAFMSEQQNLYVAGSFGPLGRAVEAELLAVDASLRLDPLESAVLRQTLPQIPPGLGLSGPLRVSSRVSGTAGALMVSDLRLTASVFESNQANLQVTGEAGPLGPDMAALNLNNDIALGPVDLPQLLKFAPLAAYLPPQLSAEGSATVTVHAEGGLNKLALTAALDATDSALRFGDQFQKPQGTPLVVSTDTRLAPESIAVQRAKIQLHTLVLTSSGEVRLGKTPGLDLQLDSNVVDLAGWQEILPDLQAFSPLGQMELALQVNREGAKEGLPAITGTLDLRQASVSPAQLPQPVTDLNTSITFTGQGAAIENASAQIGRSVLEFTASVARFSPLEASYSLSSPELWLADVGASGGQAVSNDVLSTLKSDGRLWLEHERPALSATLSSAQGRLADAPYTDLQTELSLHNQVAKLDHLSLHTLGGSVTASGHYDTGAVPPQFQLASHISHIELVELFKASLPGALDAAHGTAGLTVDLTGQGQDWQAIQPSLHGQGELEVTDGALTDVNIADEVLRRVSGLPGLTNLISPRVQAKYPALFSRHGTEFSRLVSQFHLRQGKILLDDVRLDAASYTTQGKGWLDYDRNIDFHGQLILATNLSQDIQDRVKLAGLLRNPQGQIALPFALSGSLPDVRPVPDVAAVARQVQHGVVTTGLEVLQETILDKFLPSSTPRDKETEDDSQEDSSAGPVTPQDVLREGLRQGLKGVFGR